MTAPSPDLSAVMDRLADIEAKVQPVDRPCPTWWTVEQTAEAWGCSEQTVRAAVNSGKRKRDYTRTAWRLHVDEVAKGKP